MIPRDKEPRRSNRETVARVLAPTSDNIKLLAEHLNRGGVVAVPTETVYGLAACATNERACRAVFAVKGRPLVDPLIVHAISQEASEELALWNDQARSLANAFWPGPLTLVLPKRRLIPDIVTAGGSSVAIRVSSHPVMRMLLEACGLPLAAPSANRFGCVSPTAAEHVLDSLGERIPFILDGGPCTVGIESTIVDVRDPFNPIILRPGGVSQKELENRLGTPLYPAVRRHSRAPIMPGSMERHYSPKATVCLCNRESMTVAQQQPGHALLFYVRPESPLAENDSVFWLTEDGDSREAARKLFATLHAIDAHQFSTVHVEEPPLDDLGAAIRDRLRRAAHLH